MKGIRTTALALAAFGLAGCADTMPVAPELDLSPSLKKDALVAEYACTLADEFFVTYTCTSGNCANTHLHRYYSIDQAAGGTFTGSGEYVGLEDLIQEDVSGSVAGLSVAFTSLYLGTDAPGAYDDYTVVWSSATIDPLTGIISGDATATATTPNPTLETFTFVSTPFAASCTADGECAAAPAIANAYLNENDLVAPGERGDIIKAVTEEMGPGNDFQGFEKCDAGYAAAVIAFVNSLL